MTTSSAGVDADDLDALDPDLERNDALSLLRRRLTGRFEIDEYGLDRDLIRVITPLARLRWRVVVEGDHHLPEVGPALLVHNRRLGISEPGALALAVARATGRPLRWSGVPGRGPLAQGARQLGGVPSDPADLRSLLRAGELVTVPLTRRLFGGSAEPEVPLGPIEVALELGVSIVPVAMTGLEATRRWRVCIGEPLTTRRRVSRRGPAELAGATQVAMGQLLSRSRGRRLIGV